MKKKNIFVTVSPLPVYALSIIIIILMTGVSLVSLLSGGSFYSDPEMRLSFFPADGINLAFGVPLMAVGLILAGRESMLGPVILPGGLFFVTYSYLAYVIALPPGLLFPVHLVLTALGLTGMIGYGVITDHRKVAAEFRSFVPGRFGGGLLFVLGVLLVLRTLGLVFQSAIGNAAAPGELETVQWICDFIIPCPALIVGGRLLWRKHPVGYAMGGGLLLAYALLSVGLVPLMIFQARRQSVPVDGVGIAVVLVMGLICLIPFTFFLKPALKKEKRNEA